MNKDIQSDQAILEVERAMQEEERKAQRKESELRGKKRDAESQKRELDRAQEKYDEALRAEQAVESEITEIRTRHSALQQKTAQMAKDLEIKARKAA